MPNILAVGASPRAGGNSDSIIDYFISGVKQTEATSEITQLRDLDITGCVGCEACRKTHTCLRFKDGMTDIYPKITDSKGLLLVSPVHNYNVTSWMKAFIDRLYPFYDFEEPRPGNWSSILENQNRKAVIATVCEQNDKKDMGFTLDAMKMPLEALGYEVIEEIAILGAFYKGKIVQESLDSAALSGKSLANSISE